MKSTLGINDDPNLEGFLGFQGNWLESHCDTKSEVILSKVRTQIPLSVQDKRFVARKAISAITLAFVH
jgi:hypothetical protein